LGAPHRVSAAIWWGLRHSLGKPPSILSNGVDHALIMALSRTLVRNRMEMASIVWRPMGDRDAARLYHFSTAETLRRPVTEEHGAAVEDTSTVLAP